MKLTPNYYKDRVALNVLAGSVDNAKDIYQAAEGHVICGVLTKNYPDNRTCVTDMKKYQTAVDNAISVGLGAGDPNQSLMVSEVSKILQPQHVNQVFTGVAQSRTMLGQSETVVNGLVSPTGKVGYVNIATGPFSSQVKTAEVPIVAAIAMLKDMGGSSIKYFPMKGLKHKDEYMYLAKACAANDFSLEPTGGIDLENFQTILEIAVEAGVKKIIPHVYSSIIDKDTGLTKPADVAKLFVMIKTVVD
ncbi:KDGP aldolase family protein [Lactobacillus sp. ESL0684]|uniref:2-dehydro-3-deoxy-phosphogluconate aldolase n=1 Tax=Lactobacillus sp. ESL0684 TaxID=2983213 RepID=UPI0023F66502|nr:KDGP aldolase family protein [Lactobacillus sp. ESL0684]WEV43598.1 KDGP aldolase family protein [Lactobacillus sp. ESL0684]